MDPNKSVKSRFIRTQRATGKNDLHVESFLDKVVEGHRSGYKHSRVVQNTNDPVTLPKLVVIWKQEELRAQLQGFEAVNKLEKLRSKGVDVDSYIVVK